MGATRTAAACRRPPTRAAAQTGAGTGTRRRKRRSAVSGGAAGGRSATRRSCRHRPVVGTKPMESSCRCLRRAEAKTVLKAAVMGAIVQMRGAVVTITHVIAASHGATATTGAGKATPVGTKGARTTARARGPVAGGETRGSLADGSGRVSVRRQAHAGSLCPSRSCRALSPCS